MTEKVWLAIVTGIGTAIPLLIPVMMAWIQSRKAASSAAQANETAAKAAELGNLNADAIQENTRKQEKIGQDVVRVAYKVDGRVSELIEQIRSAADLAVGKAHAEGMIAGGNIQAARGDVAAQQVLDAAALKYAHDHPLIVPEKPKEPEANS